MTVYQKVVEAVKGRTSSFCFYEPGTVKEDIINWEIKHKHIVGDYTNGGKIYLSGTVLHFDAKGNYIGHTKGGCLGHKNVDDCPCAGSFVKSKLEDFDIHIN